MRTEQETCKHARLAPSLGRPLRKVMKKLFLSYYNVRLTRKGSLHFNLSMLQDLETQDGQTYHFPNSNKSRHNTNDDSGWNVDMILIYITARTSMAPDIFRNPHTDSLSCVRLCVPRISLQPSKSSATQMAACSISAVLRGRGRRGEEERRVACGNEKADGMGDRTAVKQRPCRTTHCFSHT